MNFLSSIITSHIFPSTQKILISRNPILQTAKKNLTFSLIFYERPGKGREESPSANSLQIFPPRALWHIFYELYFLAAGVSPPYFLIVVVMGRPLKHGLGPLKSREKKKKRGDERRFSSLCFVPFPPYWKGGRREKLFFPYLSFFSLFAILWVGGRFTEITGRYRQLCFFPFAWSLKVISLFLLVSLPNSSPFF